MDSISSNSLQSGYKNLYDGGSTWKTALGFREKP